jgi:hypothetical protein
MKHTRLNPRTAMDMVVCGWIQQMEDVHFRTSATLHSDADSGDQFITIHDPVTDVCITVWRTPAWYGNDVLKLAQNILAPQLKHIDGPISKPKGGRQ